MMQKILLLFFLTLLGCKNNDRVYLCNGPQSEVYHKTNYCKGLKRCTTEIEATDLASAKAKHRRECRYCY